jgi:hypothetical protein
MRWIGKTIERLNRSFRVAEATLSLARRVAINESSWYNPVSWSLPTIYNVEVDWPRVLRPPQFLTCNVRAFASIV